MKPVHVELTTAATRVLISPTAVKTASGRATAEVEISKMLDASSNLTRAPSTPAARKMVKEAEATPDPALIPLPATPATPSALAGAPTNLDGSALKKFALKHATKDDPEN